MKANKEDLKSEFDQIYKIMETSFPVQELRTYEGQKELLESPYYQIYYVKDQEEIIAFLSCWTLPTCVFIEHLATTEKCRSKGIGKKLVLECLNDAKSPVFLEIEPITEKDPMTARRAAFYQRLGFLINDFAYQQQPLQISHQASDLLIMSLGKSYSQDEFLPYKKEIYTYVYRVDHV